MKFKPNLAVLLGLSLALPLSGATVTLNSGDALGASSFNAGTNWSDGAAPSAGNDYVVSVWGLRTPADNVSHTFAGDSLTIEGNGTTGGGGLNFKGGGVDGVITVDNLVLSGGFIQHNQGFSDEFHLAGNVTISGSNATIHAKQGNIFIEAALLGTAPLTLQATDNNNGYYVTFSSALNEYTGDVTVAGNFGLAEGGVWNFAYADGSYNSISGTGYTLLEGTLRISLPEVAEGVPEGTQWTLVGTPVGYGANFAIEGWIRRTDWLAEGAPGSWVSLARPYRFNLTTGVLERIAAKEATVNGNTVYVAHDWIEAYFGEGSVAGFDANADSDGDGYSNYEEYLAGSNPGAEGASSIPGDVDGDGLPDEWEIEHFGNLAQGPEEDTDGDYNTNLEEYLAETDPASADDFPIVYVVEVDSFVNEGWIEYYFGDISGFAPLADEDGDGYSNFEEYEAGTNPLEMISSPASGSHGIPDGWILYYYADPEKTREVILSEFDPSGDSDEDGFSNGAEYQLGTDPTDGNSIPGPIAWWHFDEATSGEVPGDEGGGVYVAAVIDSSGQNNHMRTWNFQTAPEYSEDVPLATIPSSGETNVASLYFDAGADNSWSDVVWTDTAASIRRTQFSAWTIELSFKMDPNITGSDQTMFSKDGNPFGGQPPFHVKVKEPTKLIEVGLLDGSGTARYLTGQSVIETGTWYSVAVTANQDTLSLWLMKEDDSEYQLEGSLTIEGAFYNESSVFDDAWAAGRMRWNGGETDWFRGWIDEIRVSAGALPSSRFLFAGAVVNPPVGSAEDSDGDGTPDVIEEALGLDPNDPTAFFQATLSSASGIPSLSWPSAAGLSFTIERSTTLESWEVVATLEGAAGTGSWSDDSPPEGKAFYRVVLSLEVGE